MIFSVVNFVEEASTHLTVQNAAGVDSCSSTVLILALKLELRDSFVSG